MPLSMSALPPKADISEQASACPLCARSGHKLSYSITSSVRASTDGGISSPSGEAPIFELMSAPTNCGLSAARGFRASAAANVRDRRAQRYVRLVNRSLLTERSLRRMQYFLEISISEDKDNYY